MRVIDANIILRIILRDDEALFERAKSAVRSEKCIVLNEIAAEVVYVLNKVYKIDRKELAEAVLEILDIENISPNEPEVLKAALKIYGEKFLDFADCLLIGYHSVYGYEICTFDKKLAKFLETK
ncbi:MAG: PIN domain-containing protein [Bacteroides sp.]|nr:PIN domain-containing protein [Eubacterium sp.]MCM1417663.1 PIN domain-containing protein [Roseburia sp.]MCM1461871.1 PIN domain-containing protein [Bacteroides sp.]